MKRIYLFFIMIAAISFLQAGGKKPLKVFIFADMEGIWGVVHSEQTRPGSRDYDLARKWMVKEGVLGSCLSPLFPLFLSSLVFMQMMPGENVKNVD